MGRPKGTKNTMRSPEEKEQIVLKCINENMPYAKVGKEIGVSKSVVRKWVLAYQKSGLEGLKSKTGRCGSGNPYAALHNKKNLT